MSDVEIEKLLMKSMHAFKNGDVRAGLAAALLIHEYPVAAKNCAIESQYENLLQSARFIKEPELLVCIAEELVRGELLGKNLKLAFQLLEQADRLSPFYGAYIMGQSVIRKNEALAIKLFKKGQDAGHIASMVARHRLLIQKMSIVRPLLLVAFFFVDSYTVWKAFREGIRLNERFWRYRDFYKNPPAIVRRKIGIDRMAPFTNVIAFAESATQSPFEN